MNTKLFEIRDRGTFIPAIATIMRSDSDEEKYLLRRCGYPIDVQQLVLLTRLEGGEQAECDRYNWTSGARTMTTAHGYIEENWDNLKSGDVICVETILGERQTPKISERLEV